MSCWNYVLRAGVDREQIALCHSGALGGGEQRFELDGIDYVLDRDVPAECIDGRWVLGLTIWQRTPTLPDQAARRAAQPQLASFKCGPGE